MPITSTQLHGLYLAYFGRPADTAGHASYLDNPFATVQNVAAAFALSPESTALYGALPLTREDINVIYRNLFGRDVEDAGSAYWLGEVQAGRIPAGMIAFAIMSGAQGADVTALNNKLQVSTAFFDALDTPAERANYAGAASIASARGFLAIVDGSGDSLTTALAGIAAAVNAAAPPAATPLSTGADNITGTAQSDSFTATLGTGATFNAGDKINGGEGVDYLSLTIGAGATANSVPAVAVESVERVNIVNASGQAQTIDAVNFKGATEFGIGASNAAFTLTNIAQGQAIGLRSDAAQTAAAITFSYNATATAAQVSVGPAGKYDLKVGGAAVATTTLDVLPQPAGDEPTPPSSLGSIELTGAANKLLVVKAGQETIFSVGTVSAAATDAKVTIEGAKDSYVMLGSLGAGFIEVDATKSTGTVVVNSADNAVFNAALVYRGGSGADVFHAHGQLGAGSATGGSGTGDTLVIHEALDDTSKYTQFETVSIRDGVTQSVAGMAGVTSIVLDDAAGETGVTGLTADQADNITVLGADGTDGGITITLANAGTQVDDVGLKVTGAGSKLGAITIAGVETLRIDAAAAYSLDSLVNVAALTKFEGKGAGNVTFKTGQFELDSNTANNVLFTFAASTGTVDFDASESTGDGLTFIGSSGANTVKDTGRKDSILGGAASDTVTYQGGSDQITLNGGGDVFNFNGQKGGVSMGEEGVTFNLKSADSRVAAGTKVDAAFTAAAFSAATTDSIDGIDTANFAADGTTGTRLTLNNTQIAGAAGVTHGTSLTFGTTAVAQNGFFVLALAGETNVRYVFQDVNGDSKIDTGDLMVRLVGVQGATFNDDDFSVSGGNLVYESTGAAAP